MMNYNSKKKKKKKNNQATQQKQTTGRINFVERNIGFSIEIPDTWVEVKKSSYESLGIANNTLFVFVIDEFTSLTAMFSGFADKRKYNKIFSKSEFKGHNILYQKEEEYEKVTIKYLVIDGGNKKILNAFALINGMVIDFTINLSQNSKIFDNKKLNQDPNFKVLAKILSNMKVITPINPPIFVSIEDIDPEEPISVKRIVAKEKTTAQISIETDCKYKNIVVPEYYFKYVYTVDSDIVMLSVIDNEIYFSGLKDEFVYVKEDEAFAKKIHRILSIYWDDLTKYDVGYDKPCTNSYWSMKNRDAYLLIPMDGENIDILCGIFNEIIMVLEEESHEDFLKYNIFPNSKERLKRIKSYENNEVKNEYMMDLTPVFKEGITLKRSEEKTNQFMMDMNNVFEGGMTLNPDVLKKDSNQDIMNMNNVFENETTQKQEDKPKMDLNPIFEEDITLKEDIPNKTEPVLDNELDIIKDNKDSGKKKKRKKDKHKKGKKNQIEEKEIEKPNKYVIDLAPMFAREVTVKKEVKNKYAIDLKDILREEVPVVNEEIVPNEVSNIYLMDFEDIFNEGIELNPEKIKELEAARKKYAYNLEEVDEGDLDPKKEIVTEHIVVYGKEKRYAIDINGEPSDKRDEVVKKREFDVFEYNPNDYEEYYHNISGHGLFRFIFPKGSGIKVLRDFNVFDIQDYGVLSFRVFLFKCNTYDDYLYKLDDWMKKNFESNNYSLLDKYESDANSIKVNTYILSNGRFYKTAYLYGYLVAISAVNNDEKLLQANIALENLQVGESNNQFIESYDRKMNTISLLQEQGIPYNIDLPPIMSSYEVNGKTFDQVAKRAIVLSIVCNFASDVVNNNKKKYLKNSKKFFNNLLDTFNVRSAMTNEERELFNKMDKDLAMQISWQFEGNLILMWCLGLIEEIPFPDVLVDPDDITSIVSSCGSYKEFTEKCLFRDVQDVLDLADLIYRYDWYCVDCEAKGLEPSINSEVVIERHRAVNWLLTDEEWDNVEINT